MLPYAGNRFLLQQHLFAEVSNKLVSHFPTVSKTLDDNFTNKAIILGLDTKMSETGSVTKTWVELVKLLTICFKNISAF